MNKINKRLETLIFLHHLRLLTPQLLTSLLFKTSNYTLVNEKQVYNILNTLEKKKMIESIKMKNCTHEEFNNKSAYALTAKGVEELYLKMDVLPGQVKRSTLKNKYELSELPSMFLMMPRKQREHMLLANKVHVAVYLSDKKIDSLNSIYSSVSYEVGKEKKKLRPDLIVKMLEEEKTISVEIDRLTENKVSLIEKFMNYKAYIDTLEYLPFETILFVLPDVPVRSQLMRFGTILKAFQSVFDYDKYEINLVMTTVSKINDFFVLEEIKEKQLDLISFINNHLTDTRKTNYTKVNYYNEDDSMLKSARLFVNTEDKKQEILFGVCHMFDSNYQPFLNELQIKALHREFHEKDYGASVPEKLRKFKEKLIFLITLSTDNYFDYYPTDFFDSKDHVYKHIPFEIVCLENNHKKQTE